MLDLSKLRKLLIMYYFVLTIRVSKAILQNMIVYFDQFLELGSILCSFEILIPSLPRPKNLLSFVSPNVTSCDPEMELKPRKPKPLENRYTPKTFLVPSLLLDILAQLVCVDDKGSFVAGGTSGSRSSSSSGCNGLVQPPGCLLGRDEVHPTGSDAHIGCHA